jgi:hypothetical protein
MASRIEQGIEELHESSLTQRVEVVTHWKELQQTAVKRKSKQVNHRRTYSKFNHFRHGD